MLGRFGSIQNKSRGPVKAGTLKNVVRGQKNLGERQLQVLTAIQEKKSDQTNAGLARRLGSRNQSGHAERARAPQVRESAPPAQLGNAPSLAAPQWHGSRPRRRRLTMLSLFL